MVFNNNDYSNYTFEDFLTDDDFINWVKNPSKQTTDHWSQVMANYPAKKELLNKARKVVLTLNFQTDTIPAKAQSRVWNRLQQSVQDIQTNSNQIRTLNTRKLLKYAAVFTALMIFGTYYYFSFIAQKHLQTAFGEIRTVVLPDQSVIKLNANSSITYAPRWGKGKVREVWIKGEAYFDVKHINKNEKQILNDERFIVHTGDMNIEVLGTSFNVNTRRGETKVSLNKGKIKIQLSDSQKKAVIMKPGDIVEYSARSREYVQAKVNAEKVSLWTTKKLLFENTTMTEVAKIIEENYGYKVAFTDEKLKQRTISGTLSTGSEAVLLQALEASLQVDIIKNTEEKTLVISNK